MVTGWGATFSGAATEFTSFGFAGQHLADGGLGHLRGAGQSDLQALRGVGDVDDLQDHVAALLVAAGRGEERAGGREGGVGGLRDQFAVQEALDVACRGPRS